MKIVTALSMLFELANGIIHVLLFIYSFNYPNIFANICFYALLLTWLGSFMISNYEVKDDLINFIQKTKPLAILFMVLLIYVGSLGLWGLVKYQLFQIRFSEPITPERAKIISAGFILSFYLPIWLLYPLIEKDKADRK